MLPRLTPGTEDDVATDKPPGGFRSWRRSRPFWGGLFLIIAGLELFLSGLEARVEHAR